jgi:hypothetical protein
LTEARSVCDARNGQFHVFRGFIDCPVHQIREGLHGGVFRVNPETLVVVQRLGDLVRVGQSLPLARFWISFEKMPDPDGMVNRGI